MGQAFNLRLERMLSGQWGPRQEPSEQWQRALPACPGSEPPRPLLRGADIRQLQHGLYLPTRWSACSTTDKVWWMGLGLRRCVCVGIAEAEKQLPCVQNLGTGCKQRRPEHGADRRGRIVDSRSARSAPVACLSSQPDR